MSKAVKTKTAVTDTEPLQLLVAPEGLAAEVAPVEEAPISDEVRERVLMEELERLDSEVAKLVAARQAKLKEMRDDPVLWGAVGEASERQTIGVSSPAADAFGLERSSILRELSRSYTRHIVYMTKPREEGGRGLSMEEAIKDACKHMYADDDKGTLAMFQRLLYQDPRHLFWESLRELFDREPRFAEEIWRKVKQEQRNEFDSGHLCARIVERHREFNTPLGRAEYIAVREAMSEEWQPRGGIETAMVDVLTVSYFLWMKWTGESVRRSETDPRYESHDYRVWREKNLKSYFREGEQVKHKYTGQWLDGAWDLPYQREADALAQAVEFADRYRRAFQSQVRALRDYRRYTSPVIVNNAGQVNIAADGGQQVNVQNKQKGKRKEVISKMRRPRLVKTKRILKEK